MITGYAETAEIGALGGDMVLLRKPFDTEALLAAVGQALRAPS
jgi:hypothetical protein